MKLDPEWLTIREVARRLSVSTKQVRKWVHGGQFDLVVAFSPRSLRIAFSAYEKFVARHVERRAS